MHRLAHALVVEDDDMIAMDIKAMLIELGAEKVSAAKDVSEAKYVVASTPIGFATVDYQLGNDTALALIHDLDVRGIAIVLVTGLRQADLPGPLQLRPFVEKPITLARLSGAVRNALL